MVVIAACDFALQPSTVVGMHEWNRHDAVCIYTYKCIYIYIHIHSNIIACCVVQHSVFAVASANPDRRCHGSHGGVHPEDDDDPV
jgi:hypothetical protein